MEVREGINRRECIGRTPGKLWGSEGSKGRDVLMKGETEREGV